ncbi:lamin tail domain-containing protein [Anaerophaga thermohalophila]|uniref:lamin tail domain-containing protein n=1 Tax=Anaerophaga thermohalophila TaxID=177400 RepID=UPI000380EFB5|nr:lamin tail domain-containing protein [Anaerophaga thermohalophila]
MFTAPFKRLFIFLPLCCFYLFSTPVIAQSSGSIIISEILASNSNMLEDEDGDFSDWIELYNPGDDPVNLEGWGLSDDEEEPMKWTFPEVTLAPGEYLIVWASNKNRKPDIQAPGQGITREVYLEIPGSSVDDLLSSPGFPAKPDSETIVTTVFEAPSNIDDNYGQRMHGLLKAPQTGYYVF